MNDAILLIDSYAQIYRGYHAVQGHFTAPDGTPTNAVFALAHFLIRLEKEHKSALGAFVFDKGKPFRMELAPDYKANRPHMPDDMRVQIPIIRSLIEAFGWPIIEYEGFEADDLLGSIAKTLTDHPVVIFSGDKDISQVIDERITMLFPDHKGSLARRGIEEVREKFGVEPCQIIDYLSLLGDTADNIPGVDGVGPKTAAQLLQQFGTGKAIFEHLGEIKRDSLRKKLEEGRERFEKNVKLVELHVAPPEGVCWECCKLKRNLPDLNKIGDICRKLNLKSILRELGLNEIPAEPVSDDLFAPAFKEPEIPEEPAGPEMSQLTLF